MTRLEPVLLLVLHWMTFFSCGPSGRVFRLNLSVLRDTLGLCTNLLELFFFFSSLFCAAFVPFISVNIEVKMFLFCFFLPSHGDYHFLEGKSKVRLKTSPFENHWFEVLSYFISTAAACPQSFATTLTLCDWFKQLALTVEAHNSALQQQRQNIGRSKLPPLHLGNDFLLLKTVQVGAFHVASTKVHTCLLCRTHCSSHPICENCSSFSSSFFHWNIGALYFVEHCDSDYYGQHLSLCCFPCALG